MRVFLGNAPWRKEGRWGVRAGSRWPFTMPRRRGEKTPPYLPFPFFLAYATAVLERAGVEVLLVDAVAEGMEDAPFLSRLQEFGPDLIVLETSTPSIASDLAIAAAAKEVTGAQIALTGPHVTALPHSVLEENLAVDFVLLGEYEYTLRELVQTLKAGGDLGPVLGLAYRDEGGAVRVNPRRPVIANLDELPWPARHFLPMMNYRDNFADLPQPSLQMWASRGCPFACIFCLWPEVMYRDHRYRVRNPVDVVGEIVWCLERYDLRSVYFDDDTFDLGKRRILRLCEEMKKRGLNLPWAVMARADTCDREMLEAMAEAGLYAIKYGVESGVQEILDRCGKRLSLKTVEKTVKITKELGIKVHLTFTLGLPGETEETIRRTINYALKLDPDSVQFSLTTPFPGTAYYQMLRRRGFLLASDWAEFDGAGRAVMRTAHLTREELERAYHQAVQAWGDHVLRRQLRSQPWRAGWMLLRRPRAAWRLLRRVDVKRCRG
ncbi:MAG TPA: radical SAM protein [Armatimonadetes bacterium]|nr:radical SAM protein [Armatimonadota bacterium]